jgi:phosphoglycolate phosphatase
MAPPVAHVFFDLDGTLVDTFPGIAASAQAALAAVRPDRPAPDFRPFIGPPIREIFRRALNEEDPGVLDALEQVFRRNYNAEGWRRSLPYPGAARVLADLGAAGCGCYLLTNKPRVPTESILAHLDLTVCFRDIITPDSRHPAYPSKTEAAADACRRQGLAASRTLLVGDSLDDAAAAEYCGFRFAAVAFGYGAAATQALHPVHTRLAKLDDLLLLVGPGLG